MTCGALLYPVLASAKTQSLSPAELKNVFEKAQKKFKVSGDFTQKKFVTDIDVVLETSGQYEISKTENDLQIIWKIKSPEAMDICITKERIISNQKKLKKKNVVNLKELSSDSTSGWVGLMQVMRMDPEQIAKDFAVTREGEKYIFIPKGKAQISFERAEITIDAKKNLKSVTLLEPSKDRLEITFSKDVESPLKEAIKVAPECQ